MGASVFLLIRYDSEVLKYRDNFAVTLHNSLFPDLYRLLNIERVVECKRPLWAGRVSRITDQESEFQLGIPSKFDSGGVQQ
jgi:uncharacterized protein (DUF952 family)